MKRSRETITGDLTMILPKKVVKISTAGLALYVLGDVIAVWSGV